MIYFLIGNGIFYSVPEKLSECMHYWGNAHKHIVGQTKLTMRFCAKYIWALIVRRNSIILNPAIVLHIFPKFPHFPCSVTANRTSRGSDPNEQQQKMGKSAPQTALVSPWQSLQKNKIKWVFSDFSLYCLAVWGAVVLCSLLVWAPHTTQSVAHHDIVLTGKALHRSRANMGFRRTVRIQPFLSLWRCTGKWSYWRVSTHCISLIASLFTYWRTKSAGWWTLNLR